MRIPIAAQQKHSCDASGSIPFSTNPQDGHRAVSKLAWALRGMKAPQSRAGRSKLSAPDTTFEFLRDCEQLRAQSTRAEVLEQKPDTNDTAHTICTVNSVVVHEHSGYQVCISGHNSSGSSVQTAVNP